MIQEPVMILAPNENSGVTINESDHISGDSKETTIHVRNGWLITLVNELYL